MVFLLEGAAALCAVYFAVLVWSIGIRASFLFFWPFLAMVFLGATGVWGYVRTREVSLRTKVTLCTAALTVVILVVFTSLVIASYSYGDDPKEVRYGIVLGAKVDGDVPGDALTRRLETAYLWALDNPGTQLILSGGRGEGEFITEAEAMENWLTERGFPRDRLILEPGSASTRENIRESLRLMEPGEKAAVITDGYHIFRARMIAKKQGTNVSGIPARTNPLFALHFWTREIFAVWKDKFLGRI